MKTPPELSSDARSEDGPLSRCSAEAVAARAGEPPRSFAAPPPPRPRSSRRRRRGGTGAETALASALGSTLLLLRWLLIGLVALYLTSGFTRVGPQEDALVFRLGRLQPTVHSPGFLFALPAPIDRVVRVPTRTQHERVLRSWEPDERDRAAGRRGLHPARDGYTLTADVNLVQGTFTAHYRIVDPLSWVKAASVEETAKLIEAECYRAAVHALAATRIDDALGAGLSRFRSELREEVQTRLDALKLGVELVALEIQGLVPPGATVGAFTDVTSAQVEARTAVERARTYRAELMPEAGSEAYRIRQQADAEHAQRLARAQGETSAFLALLAEHRLAPALVETRLRAEALEDVLPRVKTRTVLPSESGPLHLLLRNEN